MGAAFAPEGLVVDAPGTSAALRSRLSLLLTLLSLPPPIPPEARIDASTSSLPPVGAVKDGAFTVSLPGGSGGGGGPLPAGIGGGRGAILGGRGGGGGAPLDGNGGGIGGPFEGTVG